MRNSIRKIASLCLAMAMVLSLFAMPAFAEMRAVHIHEHNNYVSSEDESGALDYNNNTYHRYETVHYFSCDCGHINPEPTYRYEPHLSTGNGTNPKYTFDGEGNIIVTLYTYTCKICGGEYVSE